MGMMDEGRWVENVPSLPTRNRPVRKPAADAAVTDTTISQTANRTARLNRTITNVRKSRTIPAQTRNQIIDTILDRRNA